MKQVHPASQTCNYETIPTSTAISNIKYWFPQSHQMNNSQLLPDQSQSPVYYVNIFSAQATFSVFVFS
jgi:hypothetical protein